MYPLSDGTATQCDPDGEKPCCDSLFYGTCGNTVEHCSSCLTGCVNYSRQYEDWRESIIKGETEVEVRRKSW